MSEITTQELQVASLGIKYTLKETENGKMVHISEEDLNKIFDALRDSQDQIDNLQNHLIDELKKIALIRNIVVSD